MTNIIEMKIKVDLDNFQSITMKGAGIESYVHINTGLKPKEFFGALEELNAKGDGE